MSIFMASMPFDKASDSNRWGFGFLYALLSFLLSMRLLRNAFLQPPKPRDDGDAHRQGEANRKHLE
jgi:hypothetical protein